MEPINKWLLLKPEVQPEPKPELDPNLATKMNEILKNETNKNKLDTQTSIVSGVRG